MLRERTDVRVLFSENRILTLMTQVVNGKDQNVLAFPQSAPPRMGSVPPMRQKVSI